MADFVQSNSPWCFLILLTSSYFVNLVHTQDTGECRSRACYPLSEDLLQNLPNRTISASSTCGDPAENFELRYAGQFQDTYEVNMCNASVPELSHTTDMLYDFTEQNLFGNIYTRPRLDTWWQSGNTEQNVGLRVTFGDSFLFQGTILLFRSVRPLAIKIEKSNNFGQTWAPLRYYAQDCGLSFPGVTQISNRYDLPFCEQKYYYGDATTAAEGENTQKVEYSPASDLGQSFYQQTVMEYFSMTNIRIVLVQTGISAPETRSYFAVADWAVTGQCLCFGHALECTGDNKAECVCQHNTQGVSCQECMPLFNNRLWQAGLGTNENACEDCGCNGFASSCTYDALKDYGVCEGCTENTAGDKCEMCVDSFYRNPNYTDPSGNNGNTCIDNLVPYPCTQYCWPCDCNATGSMENTFCNEEDGQCQCKLNIQGRTCDECKDTFFNLQAANPVGCQECDCDPTGSLGSTNFCDKNTGQCICKTNVMGTRCDTCKVGTFNLDLNNPDGCTACECDIGGALSGQCTGQAGSCDCRPNVAGRMCETTTPGFFVPKLDGILYEAEFAGNNREVVIEEVPIDLDASDNVTSSHTGKGFMVVSPSDVVTFSDVRIPRTQRYAVYLRHRSVSTWSTISVNLAPQNTDPYTCNGVTIPGSAPVGLAPGSITPGENGGADRFGSDTLPCLKEGLYDITITFAVSSGGSTDTLLLDSLVLLPRLDDVDIFTSADTPAETKQSMQACWDASVMAYDPLRDTDVCKANEFSIMAVVYNGAIDVLNSCTCPSPSEMVLLYEPDAAGVVCLNLPSSHGSDQLVCQCGRPLPRKPPDFPSPVNRECSCGAVGTEPNTQCDSHGGQCQCQQGIVGRACDTCAANHFGNFGNGCTACNCDALGSVQLSCDQNTGDCECKTNVVGSKCGACLAEHYGLATGNGCQACTCELAYSLDNQCDDSGQCNCKPGVGGLNCDQCASGFYNLTTTGCLSCGCNFDGITENGGCDGTGQCVCRSDVVGEQCDICPEDTYGFGPWSERGCIRCYCSSHTTNCTEAAGWFEASIVSRFSLTDTGAVSPRWTGEDEATKMSVEVTDVPVLSVTDPRIILEIEDPSNLTSLYFVSPEPYHGDKRTAYGQMFTFTLRQSTTSNPADDPDGDVFIYSQYAQQPLAASLPEPPGDTETNYAIKLHENYWKKGTATGVQPTMQEMIQVLAGITYIKIRAKYTTLPRESVFLHESELQFAIDGDIVDDTAMVSTVPANFVEMCTCPPEYAGNFCELCAPGYRWQSTLLGPFSGCIQCDCNGHSDLPCDQETGACQGCLHNTAGDMCQMCQDGYYGDATGGTEGDCQPCLCPGPPGANSFSPTCDGNGNCLQCAEGHMGNMCETCVTGYYGVPTDIQNNGGQCQPCFCNRSPAECDSITGQCLNCEGNTGGMTCDVCDNGFWGNIANCQACDCDPVGGDGNCTQDQGICTCHPNVIGDRCDRCAPNSWGFNTGVAGCTLCDCHPAGTAFGASQCNLETGQCECKERVTGLKCDACINGYYDVNQGCIPCECNLAGTLASTCDGNGACACDVNTGQCTCMLATIAGRTCDKCGRVGEDLANVVEEVFVGVYPNCDPCPECYQDWRTTLGQLGDNFATQRQSLMGLLANYGSLSVDEVDKTLEYIRGNLSYAEQAIQEGTEEAGDLEAIQQGFQQIAMGVANFTVLLEAVEAREAAVEQDVEEIKTFDGSVTVDGSTRNAAQLQQELDALVNTRETIFRLANGSWFNIQDMYQMVEDQEVQIQQLDILVEKLLDDTERAANERRDARDIITNDARDTEFGENFQRLKQIDTIQQAYSLENTQLVAAVAEGSTTTANTTAQEAKELAELKKGEAEAKSYQSEVAKFNATTAAEAADKARTSALTYKDIALGAKTDMSDLYRDVLDVNLRLRDTNTRRTLLVTTAFQVQAINLRSPEEMTALVNQINEVGVNAEDAQTYLDDAAAGLKTAEETRNTSQKAQMESASVDALKNTIEYEITQAETTRANTASSLDMSDAYINSISNAAQQVMMKGEAADLQGHSTSDALSAIRIDAQNNDQCLRSKRNQAENAQVRAESAKLEAQAAQQAYIDSDTDQQVLRQQITTASTDKTAAHASVTAVSNSATALYDSVITVKQMEDLDALINQYIQQRNEMQQLTNQLDAMETDLNAIMANLDGTDEGSLQCNN